MKKACSKYTFLDHFREAYEQLLMRPVLIESTLLNFLARWKYVCYSEKKNAFFLSHSIVVPCVLFDLGIQKITQLSFLVPPLNWNFHKLPKMLFVHLINWLFKYVFFSQQLLTTAFHNMF